MVNQVKVGEMKIGGGAPLTLIAGPCVIESAELVDNTAKYLKDMATRLNINLIFKSSFDKANRTGLSSFRGPGFEEGLEIMAEVKRKYNLAVVSDIHET
ncbi:MAG: 3-deoxy-8-phosphooctulonate synthase, partial [Candidatus Adiutrix sp.]